MTRTALESSVCRTRFGDSVVLKEPSLEPPDEPAQCARGQTAHCAARQNRKRPPSKPTASHVMHRLKHISLVAAMAALMLAGVGCRSEPQSPAPAETTAQVDTTTSPSVIEQLGDTTLREAGRQVQYFGLRVFLAVIVLVLAVFVIRGFVFLLEKLAASNAERRLFYKRMVPIVRIILWTIATFVILRGIFELDATSLLAAAAAIGVAIGFAAQDIIKNIFGGLVILFDQPFQVGDKVAVGGTYGEVASIGLRSTRITTPDDNRVSVPNSQIVDGQVANANAGALDCQVVTDLYLPGWVDEAKAKQIAYEAAVSAKYVYLNKPIVVLVKDEFDKTHFTRIRVKAYVLDTRYEFLLQSEITERARLEFRREGLLKPWQNGGSFADSSAGTSLSGTSPAGSSPSGTALSRTEPS